MNEARVESNNYKRRTNLVWGTLDVCWRLANLNEVFNGPFLTFARLYDEAYGIASS